MAENLLLDSLPSDLRRRIEPDLVALELSANEVLAERGRPYEDVYFPRGCMISVIVEFADGRTVEAELIGRQGHTGIAALLDRETAINNMIVQVAGPVFRIDRGAFRRHLEDDRFRIALGTYSARAFSNIAQLAGCIAFHLVEQRLARWLLMVRDAIDQDEFPLTQAFIGVMLGVPRQTVTNAVRVLERAALIEHRRGFIKIIDALGLEEASCECYAAIRAPVQPS